MARTITYDFDEAQFDALAAKTDRQQLANALVYLSMWNLSSDHAGEAIIYLDAEDLSLGCNYRRVFTSDHKYFILGVWDADLGRFAFHS